MTVPIKSHSLTEGDYKLVIFSRLSKKQTNPPAPQKTPNQPSKKPTNVWINKFDRQTIDASSSDFYATFSDFLAMFSNFSAMSSDFSAMFSDLTAMFSDLTAMFSDLTAMFSDF